MDKEVVGVVDATATTPPTTATTMMKDTLRTSHGSGATVTPPRPWRVSARHEHQPELSVPPLRVDEPRAPPAARNPGTPIQLVEDVAEGAVDIAVNNSSLPSSVAKVAATVGKSLARSCARRATRATP